MLDMRKLHTHYTLGLIGAAMVAGTTSSSAEIESLLGGFIGEEVTEGLSGEVSIGYDTDYYYRGLFFGGDNVWTGVDLSKDICEGLTFNVGAYYLDTVTDGPTYSESGISTGLSWDSGFGTFDAAFTFFRFFDGFDGDGIGQQDATELSLTYSTEDFYGFSGYGQFVWDLRIDAGYLEAGIAQSVDLGVASFDLSAAIGYSIDGYYTAGATVNDAENGFTHVLLSAALPIQLLDNVTLTPHISVNISLESRDGINEGLSQDDANLFGGASLAVTF